MRFFNFALIAVFCSQASAERVSSTNLDLGKVEKIFVGPGLISVIEMPEDVLEARVGAPQIFKVSVSSANARELLIYVGEAQPFSTNLVVRTVRRTFVFDLIPNASQHQDFVQVRGGYGAPSARDAVQVDQVKLEPQRRTKVTGQLIEKGSFQ